MDDREFSHPTIVNGRTLGAYPGGPMKRLALAVLTASLSFPAFAAQDKPAPKEQPKMAEACKTGCKMPDDKCSEKCMKSCEDHAKAKKAEPKKDA
jgi:hypothetical protein